MVKIIKSVSKSIGHGIKNDPEIKKITSHYPKFFRFIKKRLTLNEKYGLYLTIGTIITLFFIYLFFNIVQGYVGQEKLIQVDLRIINLISQFQSPSINKLMLFITHLAKGPNIIIGVIVVSLIFILRRNWQYLSTLLISVVGAELFVWIIKNIIDRPRPPLVNALVYETSYSFPSGHTFAAISFYGLLVFFVLHSERNKALKRISFIIGLILVLWIGISRVYLGAHWPSDVFASFVAGIAWLTIIITSTKIKLKFNHFPKKPKLKQKTIIKATVFLLIFWLFFIWNFFRTHPLENQKYPPLKIEKTAIKNSEIPQKLFAELPTNSESIDGTKMEPINIIVISTEENLHNSFIQANWFSLDKLGAKSIWKLANALLFKKPYPNTPSVPVFWGTHPNTINFGKPTNNNSPNERHHVHFWPTSFTTLEGQDVWVGTSHFDQEIKGVFTPIHTTNPAVDKERDLIRNDLEEINKIKSFEEFQITEATFGTKQSGNQFFTDGKAYILFLNND